MMKNLSKNIIIIVLLIIELNSGGFHFQRI